jgi:hypothetical protein
VTATPAGESRLPGFPLRADRRRGGLQRTAREYGALLAECGFRMERVIDTPTGISIVEARSA